MSCKCSVILNTHAVGSVYAGDIVTGSVLLELNKQQTFEKIDFQVFGYSKAKWSRPKPTMPHIKIYSEKRKVLHIEMDVFSEIIGKSMDPGSYNFPFHFALPDDVPSTFATSIGKTFYYINTQFHGKWGTKEVTPFIVQRNVNLNEMEEFLKPSTYTFQKIFWNSGAVTLTFKTYNGFSANQLVPFEIAIENDKKVKIREVKVLLIQKRHYSIKEAYADEEKVVCKTNYKMVLSTTNYDKFKLSMDIPRLTPSSIKGADHVINISYVLRVEVIFLFHTTLYEDIPITLATVPVIHSDFDI
ncbi:arrestin domain-containing protein 2-like [Achroia grisella]|uniref:arrestin domain-containing protein 2-like n=1 Tax=Achroia grisella TaxID=688607 RepID=UPI0027D222C8|nr:arrestin domain-containing protein 2-like [Achroia grisella]